MALRQKKKHTLASTITEDHIWDKNSQVTSRRTTAEDEVRAASAYDHVGRRDTTHHVPTNIFSVRAGSSQIDSPRVERLDTEGQTTDTDLQDPAILIYELDGNMT